MRRRKVKSRRKKRVIKARLTLKVAKLEERDIRSDVLPRID